MYCFQIVEFCSCFLIHVYNSGKLILNGKIFEFFRGLWWYEGHDYSPWVFKTFPSIFNSLHPNYPWIFHELRIYAPFWLILRCSFLLGSWGSNEGALSNNVRGFCKAIPDKLRWGTVLKCSVRHCFSSFFFISRSEINFELSSALSFSKQFLHLKNRTAVNHIWIITPGRKKFNVISAS